MKKQIVSENANPVKVHPKPSLAIVKAASLSGVNGASTQIGEVANGVEQLLNTEEQGGRGAAAKLAIWTAANKAALLEASRQGVNLVEVDRTVSHFRGS